VAGVGNRKRDVTRITDALIILHFALCALHFEMDEPTELPKFAKTPSHRRHVTGRFFAALRMT
jgi:hypothetical protein